MRVILSLLFLLQTSSRGDPKTKSRSQEDVGCSQAAQNGQLWVSGRFARDSMAGEYHIVVVAVSASKPDSVAAGDLTLRKSRSGGVHKGEGALQFPLWGWTDVDLRMLGRVSLAYSPESRDSTLPGVQGIYDSQDHSLTLLFGAAMRENEAFLDAGALFHITQVDKTGFRGTWQDGGALAHLVGGYFCATRLQRR